jgi:iron complex outermembrane receptor protein
MKYILLYLLIFSPSIVFGQNIFNAKIIDEKTGEVLVGVNVFIHELNTGAVSNQNGIAVIKNIPAGRFDIKFSYIGYKPYEMKIHFPLFNPDTTFNVSLEQKAVEMNEVQVTSTRTSNRVEDTPIRVEVLGLDEVKEETGIKPGNISKLLGETSGVQIQQTSATSGNVVFRIQGLPGRYTQLLKDGFPLYSGFSSGLSLLQIPPLDIQQVEVIEGSSSTLYGGGAIAGIVNLVSRTPGPKPEWSVLLNQTQKGESDISSFYSGRTNRLGVTFMASYSKQKAEDVNHDGFTDIPQFEQANFTPKLFYYFNDSTSLIAGLTLSYDNRKGGDIYAINNAPDSLHSYINSSNSSRTISILKFTKKFSSGSNLTFKNSISSFNRDISVSSALFKGNQISSFSELSYLSRSINNNLVLGLNFNTDRFTENDILSVIPLDYNYYTIGIFGLDNWDISKKITMQSGLRVNYHNKYKSFILPNLAFLYRFTDNFYMRLGGGSGYIVPTAFTDQAEEQAYNNVYPIASNIKPEKSFGADLDFNYHAIVFNDFNLSIDQSFYYTKVNNSLIPQPDSLAVNKIFYINSSAPLESKGSNTNLELSLDDFGVFIDYTYTDAAFRYSSGIQHLLLTPINKLNTTFTYEVEDDWKSGIEAFYTGRQYLDNNTKSPGYWTIGVMIEKIFKHFSIVGNVENLFDVRQTKYESIVIPPYTNPTFKQLYAPIDGVVANIELKIKM